MYLTRLMCRYSMLCRHAMFFEPVVVVVGHRYVFFFVYFTILSLDFLLFLCLPFFFFFFQEE